MKSQQSDFEFNDLFIDTQKKKTLTKDEFKARLESFWKSTSDYPRDLEAWTDTMDQFMSILRNQEQEQEQRASRAES